MILLIDNYDSFTYNLAHLIAQTPAAAHEQLAIHRNDSMTVSRAMAMAPRAIILSPGPSTPDKAGICLDLIAAAAETMTPVFGVCLGLQSIAQAFGGGVARADKLMHGKTSAIKHDASRLFNGIPDRFTATRYHSLIADPFSLPHVLEITARSVDDNEIMAIEHRTKPIAAVQFHPESTASEYGAVLMENFLTQMVAP